MIGNSFVGLYSTFAAKEFAKTRAGLLFLLTLNLLQHHDPGLEERAYSSLELLTKRGSLVRALARLASVVACHSHAKLT